MKASRQDARAAAYDRGRENALAPEEASTVRILARVCREFIKTPGLRLTGKRAQTLWGLDESTCIHVLSLLVDAKFLCRVGDDYGLAMGAPASVTVSRSRLTGAAAIDQPAAVAAVA
jgi:hypothetical protein